MDGWGPHFTITVLVFACYVLIAVFGSRERGQDRPPSVPAWHKLRSILRLLRERHALASKSRRNS
jgi:hypothetical protein